MKKIIYAFIVLFCVVESRAQSWGHPGSTWTYEYIWSFTSGVGGVVNYTLANVFTQGTKTCQTITGTFTGTDVATSGLTATVIPNWKTYTTCKSNDVIYYGNDTVVNFNAAKGDKWLRIDLGAMSCNSRRAHVVLDTGHLAINGFNLRYVVVQYTNTVMSGSNTSTVTSKDTILERLYLCERNANGFDMIPYYCEVDNMIPHNPVARFRCYSDNAFPAHNGIQAGCGLFTDLSNIRPNSGIRVYPSPAHNLIHVLLDGQSMESFQKLSVYSVWGQLLIDRRVEPGVKVNTLPIEELLPGIYFLKVNGSDGTELITRFIAE